MGRVPTVIAGSEEPCCHALSQPRFLKSIQYRGDASPAILEIKADGYQLEVVDSVTMPTDCGVYQDYLGGPEIKIVLFIQFIPGQSSREFHRGGPVAVVFVPLSPIVAATAPSAFDRAPEQRHVVALFIGARHPAT